MGDFDVFDDWGNFVGKFTPAGGGGCLFGIAILILLAAGFVIYQFIKMVVMGFVALSKGKWGEALMYWFFPGSMVLFFALSTVGNVTVFLVNERRAEEYQLTARAEENEFLANPPVEVAITKGKCNPSTNNCGWGTDRTYLVVTVTNLSKNQLATMRGDPELWCTPSITWYYLTPGRTEKFYCVLGGAAPPDFERLDRVCIYFSTGAWDSPTPLVCRNLK